MHPQLPAPALVWFKVDPVRTLFPFFSGISLHRDRSHSVQADHPRAGDWGLVSRDDAPLFSKNSGSAFWASWNQLSWRFQRKPSPRTHSQMVESDKCTPSPSWKAVWMRSNVHSLKGYPGSWALSVLGQSRHLGQFGDGSADGQPSVCSAILLPLNIEAPNPIDPGLLSKKTHLDSGMGRI